MELISPTMAARSWEDDAARDTAAIFPEFDDLLGAKFVWSFDS
jgi:hypothetical protein